MTVRGGVYTECQQGLPLKDEEDQPQAAPGGQQPQRQAQRGRAGFCGGEGRGRGRLAGTERAGGALRPSRGVARASGRAW